jgi:hypothetical protein
MGAVLAFRPKTQVPKRQDVNLRQALDRVAESAKALRDHLQDEQVWLEIAVAGDIAYGAGEVFACLEWLADAAASRNPVNAA